MKTVLQLPFNIYIKTAFNAAEEVAATRYVEENTSIPVPHILDYIPLNTPEFPRMGFVIMKAVSGHPLGQKGELLHEFTQEQKDTFVGTLRSWLQQLRSLAPVNKHQISGFLGGGLVSFRIGDVLDGPFGPFHSQDEFHAQDFCTPWAANNRSLTCALEHRLKTPYKICLTHGDLTPSNILIDDSGCPVALIDWETASWMPEYWEYTRALYMRTDYIGWREAFDRIFPCYGRELTVERAIWEHWVSS
ncbi:kinase-like domain-containing protein [Crepidotus variabilis]|uniref:Kinase-like domain-containing protein n=1 Tax=Crepidotus variabilis TaxID=179855 RepID=A0A9P6E5A8_9AGAR|nr:kinase-like domain-containing protein [Crepidotus variabilis]